MVERWSSFLLCRKDGLVVIVLKKCLLDVIDFVCSSVLGFGFSLFNNSFGSVSVENGIVFVVFSILVEVSLVYRFVVREGLVVLFFFYMLLFLFNIMLGLFVIGFVVGMVG